MKKLFLTLLVALAGGLNAYAVNVSGTIAANTSWTLANSPYVVTAALTVNPGITLTIDSGVVVRVNNAVNMTFNGNLVANRVTFESADAIAGRGKYGTLLFAGTVSVTNSDFRSGTLLDFTGTAAKNFNGCTVTKFTNGITLRSTATLTFAGGALTDCASGFTIFGGSRVNFNNASMNTIDGIAFGSISSGLNTISLDNATVSNIGTPINCSVAANIFTTGINSFSQMNTNAFVVIGFTTQADTLNWGSLPVPYHLTTSYTVNAGELLTIGTGNTVKFPGGANFYANGSIVATNTTFDAISTTQSRGQYNSLNIAGSATFSNCTFNRGTVLDFSGTSQKTMTNCTVNKFTNGVSVQGTPLVTFTGGSITDCSRGVYLSGAAEVSFDGTNISQIDNEALYAVAANATFRLHNATINNVGTAVRMGAVCNLLTSGNNQFLQLNTRKFIWVEAGSMNHPAYLGYVNIPYHLTSGMTVSTAGRLQIASNNIFKSMNAFYIDGKFIAEAIPGESIYFTSLRDDNWGGDSNGDANITSPARNDWTGFLIRNTAVDSACLFKRVQIRFANYAIETNSSSPRIDSCTLSINTRGVNFEGESSPIFTNNTLASSQQVPIALDFNADPVMVNNTFSFSDNQFDAIGLIGSQVTRNSIIKVRSLGAITNITYVMLSTEITVLPGITLTIAPGVVIKHAQQSFYYNIFKIDGTLIMEGKSDSVITITSVKDDAIGNPFDTNKDGNSTTPTVNDLGPIFITQTGGGSRIKHAHLKYMGGGYYYGLYTYNSEPIRRDAAVVIYNASPSIRNSVIESGVFGVFAYRSSNPVIDSIQFVNLSNAPVAFSMSANPTLTNISFTNVGWRALGLLGRNVSANGTVARRNVAGFTNITYVVFEEININQGTHVDIADGVIIKFANTGSRIIVEGSLRTLGTAANKVVFTSIKADNLGNPGDTNGDGSATSPNRGDWDHIEFLDPSNDTTSLLSHLEISYATRGTVLRNANTRFRNVLINQASSYGIITHEASRPDIDSSTIQNCNGDPIALSYASDPVFGPNIVFSQNISSGLFLHETNLNSPAQLKSKNVAGINNIAYIIETVNINSGGRLSIDPTVVIKMRRLFWYSSAFMDVTGGIFARGTNSQKIYITSWKDDSVGGDTNNDGNGSVPENTDFNYIRFTNVPDSTRAYFKNVQIKYGGYSSEAMINFVNSAGYIDSCNLEHISARGIRISGTSNPRIRNTKFFNIPTHAPLWISMFSNPEIHLNNELQNVAYYTIELIPEVFSQDATFIFRNFAGIDSITYMLRDGVTAPTNTGGHMVVANGTTINIPAGMIFKIHGGNGVFGVDGRLNMNGTAQKPIIVTDYRDDTHGRPADMNGDGSASAPPSQQFGGSNGSWMFDFKPVSNDSSTIRNVLFRFGNRLADMSNASPDLRHVYVDRTRTGIHLYGSSTPKIDSCTFHNLYREALNTSVLTWPASASGNVLSGTTYRAVAIPGESLVQDITLQKRSFGGMTNVPYYFPNGFTVANNAILTLSPGLVLKFEPGNQLVVNKGLVAEGGFTPDSNIVMTTIMDDFYGGDSDANGIPNQNTLNSTTWRGVLVNNEAIDNEVRFHRVIFRYGSTYSPESEGFIRTISASPVVTYCTFDRGVTAVSASAASNPVINFCDFKNMEWGVYNTNRSFNIDARNNWWGNNSGPTHAGNPAGTGAKVTDSVRYTPWLINGSHNPILGDVSLNGQIQAFDAAMVLQANVSLITLNATQQLVADVTGNSTVSAMDASYILQYVTGIINKFPAEELFFNRQFPDVSRAVFALGKTAAAPGHLVRVPLHIRQADGMLGADLNIQFDANLLHWSGVEGVMPGLQLNHQVDPLTGTLYLSVAGIQQLSGDVRIAELVFEVAPVTGSYAVADIRFDAVTGNETDLLLTAEAGFVEINALTTSVGTEASTPLNTLAPVYPNPVDAEGIFSFNLSREADVRLEITDMTGRTVVVLADGKLEAGAHQLVWSGNTRGGGRVATGTYLARLSVAGQASVQQILVK